MAQLLITGGAGFIGSHTCLVLLEAGHDLVVLDNYSNSSPEALHRVADLAQVTLGGERLRLVEGDIRNPQDLRRAFASLKPMEPAMTGVIHFAGLKAVGESVRLPLDYWDVNVTGSRCLFSAMREHGCCCVVFSSSATLYGLPDQIPIPETAPIRPINPYGHTKAAVEELLQELANSESGWRIARLRYFNPVGAHPSGRIGEDPQGTPNNLFPYVSQVAVGRRHSLQIYGDDWPTADGTGIRDYIHVMDLAEGHQLAIEHLLNNAPQVLTLNLGSGQGHSVLDVVQAFEQASGRAVPYRIEARRDGDAAITVADAAAAEHQLNWRTRRSLMEMCQDGWAWQSNNPEGYKSRTQPIQPQSMRSPM